MHIVIPLFDGITALDAVGPYEALARLPDVTVQFVAKTRGPIRTGDGFLALHADADIASARQADMLIVPGGHKRGLAVTIHDPDVQEWVRAIDAGSRWTTSVCTGSLILAAAGILAGRSASTHWRAKAALARYGLEYSPRRVTIDGKYVTSAGVSAGLDMACSYAVRSPAMLSAKRSNSACSMILSRPLTPATPKPPRHPSGSG